MRYKRIHAFWGTERRDQGEYGDESPMHRGKQVPPEICITYASRVDALSILLHAVTAR
jgi:hypothetical protein